jgi:tetratricopeptide (TPR) repeat protein
MRLIPALFLVLPGLAFAAGSDTPATTTQPPKTTQTTDTCKGVQVWDAAKKKCVNPQGSALDTDTLYGAVRELAYAGRYRDAQGVLAAMPDQNDDRVLTYWGFTWRKMGDQDLAQEYYIRAITRNPDNLLARSYMGQGLVESGKTDAAMEQLREIKARGGAGSWAETALSQAVESGETSSY